MTASESVFPSSVLKDFIPEVKEVFETVVVAEACGGTAKSDSPSSAVASDSDFELDPDHCENDTCSSVPLKTVSFILYCWKSKDV